MSRKAFGKLLQKYLSGECTPDEKAFVEHWYGLLDTETEGPRQELDMDELEARLWNQIQRQKNAQSDQQTRVLPLRTTLYRWVGVAAALVLIGWLYVSQQVQIPYFSAGSSITLNSSDWTERTNASTHPLVIRLEDGSAVTLAVNSSLRFPKHFATESRKVYLKGDAFFSVAKMPTRPFYVHTGSVVTKVLGTSFFVRSQAASKQVQVEVVTGRVAVYEETTRKAKANHEVVLSPNQTATFLEEEQHFIKGLVAIPRVLSAPASEAKAISFQFDDTPLGEVLTSLEKAYGINIEVANPSQNNCPLTADLTNQPLYTQLDIICAALKAKYDVQGTTILLTGKGCDE